ncbi:ABC transporter ATP-binding protein [Candidatus Peregrinibacteria bacterium]|nr:ABC transporter ATP-binding protein [Candidatus Peregrinibacteria bacterium]
MQQEVVITAKNIAKKFVLYHEKRRTLREHILYFWKPNRKENFYALKDVNFEVKKGEFFGIIGRNGSGKSTLLKMIAQVYEPTRGKIEKKGLISPFLELGVGFNEELTARENIYMNGTILGLTSAQIDERFDQIVDFAELLKFVDTKLKHFSSGMHLRLAFSVAIQADADILLLDEVLAVGDASFQQKCFETFRQFKKAGKTIVFVSHDLGAMRQFCNRVMYLKDGNIEAIGDPNEVIDRYLYSDKQIADLVQTAKHDGGKKPVEIVSVEFIDKFGHENKTYLTADRFIIRVHYKKNVPMVEKPVLGIAIYRDDGTHIYGTNTDLQNLGLELAESGVIELCNQNLPIIQGKFLVTLAFHHKDGTVYDWQDKKFEFYVQKGSNHDGLVDLDFKYKIL